MKTRIEWLVQAAEREHEPKPPDFLDTTFPPTVWCFFGWETSLHPSLFSCLCRKGETEKRDKRPGPERGLLSNTRKWTVRGDTRADNARDFTGKGHPGWEQQGKGNQDDCSAMWLEVSGFMVMGLFSGLSLANHSDSGSFLVACTSLNQDGIQREGFWEDVWTGVSSLLLTFPKFIRLVVTCQFRVPYQDLLL